MAFARHNADMWHQDMMNKIEKEGRDIQRLKLAVVLPLAGSVRRTPKKHEYVVTHLSEVPCDAGYAVSRATKVALQYESLSSYFSNEIR